MIVLPDDDETPVSAQVHALVGAALRASVAQAEVGPGFAARLAAALDELERAGGAPGPCATEPGERTVDVPS
jgi:hypothetical protein